jgi:hypothetical protein
VLPKGDAKIQIADLRVNPSTKNSAEYEMRIRGLAGGTQPRATAERFLQEVAADLKRIENVGSVGTHFERAPKEAPEILESGPAEFVLIATFAVRESPLESDERKSQK